MEQTLRARLLPARGALTSRAVVLTAVAITVLNVVGTVFVSIGTFVVVLPALGVASGAAIRGPRSLSHAAMTVLVASQLVVSLATGATLTQALIVAFGELVVVVVVARLARLAGLDSIRRPRDVLLLAGVAGAGAALAGAVAAADAAVRVSMPYVPGTAASLQAFVGVGLAVAVGVLIAAPAVIEAPARTASGVRGRAVEAAVLVAVATAVVLLLVVRDESDWLAHTGAAFVLLPFAAWAALRFGPSLTSVLLVVLAEVIGWSIAAERGVFAPESAPLGVVALGAQVFLLVMALGSLLLSVYAEHLRRQEAEGLATAQLLDQAIAGVDAQLFVKRYDPPTDRFVFVEANHTFARSLGLEPGDVIGRADEEFLSPAEAAEFRRQDELVFRSGTRQMFEGCSSAGGRPTYYSVLRFPISADDGVVVGVGGVCIDRTEEHRREELLGQMFARSPVPTARLRLVDGRAGEVLEANAALGGLLGVDANDLVGHDLDAFLAPGVVLPAPRPDADEVLGPVRSELRLRRRDGDEVTALLSLALVEAPGEPSALLILEDVTARRAAEANLLHRASHDPLTDLLNRQAAAERIAEALVRLRRRPATLAVLCCDIDGFKYLNESFGHEAGDQTLREVAARLLSSARPGDVVARLGADEFVVVCEGLPEPADALGVAERLRSAVARPIQQGGQTFAVTLSVGVTVTDDPRRSPHELLREADTALSRGKEDGPDHVSSYHSDLGRRAAARVAIRERIRRALADDTVEIHLQPMIDVASGCVVGAEALVRLRDEDGSLLPPGAFIDVAEDSGLIVPLGERVLDLALGQLSRWSAAGFDLGVSVNVSPRQLTQADFPRTVRELLAHHRVAAAAVTLEVTESAVVDPGGSVLATLRRLRELGVHVAIDDFGTGYSSLTSLRNLPADEVKVDRSFVSGLGRGVEDDAIVRAVISMARDTGRGVVAEGVETRQQLDRLVALGCHRVQGFLFGRPAPAAELDPAAVYDVGGGPKLRLAHGGGA